MVDTLQSGESGGSSAGASPGVSGIDWGMVMRYLQAGGQQQQQMAFQPLPGTQGMPNNTVPTYQVKPTSLPGMPQKNDETDVQDAKEMKEIADVAMAYFGGGS